MTSESGDFAAGMERPKADCGVLAGGKKGFGVGSEVESGDWGVVAPEKSRKSEV
jgi:hypothetical protein